MMEYQFSKRIGALKPSAIREMLKFTVGSEIIPFAAGNPSPDAFPKEAITEIAADILANNAITALQYGISEGYAPLREALKAYLKEKKGLGTDTDDLNIMTGAQQGIELCTKVFCDDGDTVICENPSFIGSLNAFRSYEANLAGVDMEDDGMDIDMLEAALKREKNVRFIYTIPNFQNPSGITMSAEKRKRVYELALRHGVLILEDDPYGDLRYSGGYIPPIKALDTEGIVFYIGSFSKIISPGLRVGYIMAPQQA
ncbi:MAG: PLP-dependent aminotransferase family protein, partial [Clostridiales bacterium]|nr:PLP-dependent aminotransferase family protein [Clostridiales bacterium]